MNLKTDSKRIFGLDIFRAVAIIIVVMVHGGFMLDGSRLEGFPFFNLIDGVDIFFVLSGFLIGGILLKELNKTQTFGFSDLLQFWKRRWFRTLPNYYLILAANYFVVRYGIINEDIEQFNFHFITFTQNFAWPFQGFFWESWSLSIEEWFYLFSPLLILLLCKFLSNKTAFLVATVSMIVLPLLYRYSMFNPDIDYFNWDISFRKTVLCRLDSIGYGLLFAWVFFYYKKLWSKISIPSFALGLILLFFIMNSGFNQQTLYQQTIYFSLIPFAVMLLLPLTTRYKKATGILPLAIQHISKISYSMYLINLALVAEVIRDNFAPQGGMDGVLKYLLYWTIVIVASTLLYKLFEKPMMDLRDKKLFSKK